MEQITSKTNHLIKLIAKLNSSKKWRQAEGLFVVEGVRLVQEAIKTNLKIKNSLITPEAAAKHPDLIKKLVQSSNTALISTQLEAKISSSTTPPGVYCVCKMPASLAPKEAAIAPGRQIVLVDLQDPGNVGTIIRTAEAFKIDTVYLTQNSVDVYSPKVIKSAMGSCFRQKIATVTNILDFIAQCNQSGAQTYAAVLSPQSLDFETLIFDQNSVVFVGNEGNGLPQNVVEAIKYHVKIPMHPSVESLNVSVAAAIFMHKLYCQQK